MFTHAGGLLICPQACRNGFAEIVTTLLYAGADANTQSALGVTPLLQAAQAGRARIVRELLENGIDVDIDYGEPCHVFSACRSLCTTLLTRLATTAAPSAIPSTGWTALMCAVDEGHYTVAERLLKMKASVAHTTPHGINALTLAIRQSNHYVKSKSSSKNSTVYALAISVVWFE